MKRKREKTKLIAPIIAEELHRLIYIRSINIAEYLIEHISDADWEDISLSLANKLISVLDDEEEKDE